MKKVIISMLLIALAIGSVFAFATPERPDSKVPVSVAAKFAISENGVKAQSAGIYAEISEESLYFMLPEDFTSEFPMLCDIRVGYLYSFASDPSVSGVYADVLWSKMYEGNNPDEFKPLSVKPGISADFHIVNNEFKANVAAAAEIDLPLIPVTDDEALLKIEVGVKLMPRYILWNNTGADAFTLEISTDNGITQRQ